jgi:GAF domain-containing protein
LTIAFGRGVCGKAAATGEIQIVSDTHALTPGRDHIACDPNSASEIVLPVFKQDGTLMGVFDVDATEKDAFDEIDAAALEALLQELFSGSGV